MLDYKIDAVAFDVDKATWECSKCGNLNSSIGHMEILNIVSQGDAYTNAIKEDPDNILIDAPWKYVTDKIITSPEKSSRWIRNYLNLENCKCSKCGYSEVWSRLDVLSKVLSVPLILLLGGIAIYILMGQIAGIYAALVGALVLVASSLEKKTIKKKIRSLKKESFPKITIEKEAYDVIYSDEKNS